MYHSLLVCENIAEKLCSSHEVKQGAFNALYQNKYKSDEWHDWSLAEGMSGIAYFFAAAHQIFPDKNWNQVANHYIELALQSLENSKIANCSLYQGLAGLGLTVFMMSNGDIRHSDLLANLDNFLIEKVHSHFLEPASQYEDSTIFIPSYFYDLEQGLSGIIAYLLLRKENNRLQKLAYDCVDCLSKILLSQKSFEGLTLPAWYVSSDHLLLNEVKDNFPNGCFIVNFLKGITGCLAALSLAMIAGIQTPQLRNAIRTIAYWLKGQQKCHLDQPFWDSIFSIGNSTSENLDQNRFISQDSWAAGWPTITRSLFLAAKAIDDKALSDFAYHTYLSLFNQTIAMKKWNDSSFSFGLAGFLATAFFMWQDTSDYQIFRGLNKLENELTVFYDPNLIFGFRPSFLESPDYQSIHLPGLLHGSIGIVLTLLLVQKRLDPKWMKLFLTI